MTILAKLALKLWIYENHIWKLWGEEIDERRCTGIAEVKGLIPYKLEFFQAFFSQLQKLRL